MRVLVVDNYDSFTYNLHLLQVSSRTDDGEVMGVRHRVLPIEVCSSIRRAFSPRTGRAMLRSFLDTLRSAP